MDEGGLSAPRFPHKGDGASAVDSQVHTVQNFLVGPHLIGKFHLAREIQNHQLGFEQSVGKYQSCMVISGRLIVHALVDE